MDFRQVFREKFKIYGTGRRKLDDKLFAGDKIYPRLGIYDDGDESLFHEVIKTTCHVPGCVFTADSLLEFENHYNSSHRYSCSQCKKVLPSPHLLDLHIQEKHDSFFAVMSAKKPSYCCYIEECKEKFINSDERLEHCVTVHKLPRDFRFDQKPKAPKKPKPKNKNVSTESTDAAMELDSKCNTQKFSFCNSKQKAFSKYSGRKFTKDNEEKKLEGVDVDMDSLVEDLKESLPQ